MQMRHLLERNRHFINHRFTDNPAGAEKCKVFKEAAYKIIDAKRVSDWSPVKALEVQEIIYTYQTEPEATFLFFVWHALLNKSRHTYQRPYEEERRTDMERWMEQSWTKDHLRYKFNIDFARDSVPPRSLPMIMKRNFYATPPEWPTPNLILLLLYTRTPSPQRSSNSSTRMAAVSPAMARTMNSLPLMPNQSTPPLKRQKSVCAQWICDGLQPAEAQRPLRQMPSAIHHSAIKSASHGSAIVDAAILDSGIRTSATLESSIIESAILASATLDQDQIEYQT